MRATLLLAAPLLLLLLLSGCSGSTTSSSTTAGDNKAQAMEIRDFNFNPTTLNAKVGTTVTWTNHGSATHTVTEHSGAFDSGDIAAGGAYSHTFDAAGSFTYHCKIHPNMTGTVTVTA